MVKVEFVAMKGVVSVGCAVWVLWCDRTEACWLFCGRGWLLADGASSVLVCTEGRDWG